jgi:hypothetical protein
MKNAGPLFYRKRRADAMEYASQESDADSVLAQLLKLIVDMPPEKRAELLHRLETEAFEEGEPAAREEKRKLYYKPVYFDFENFTYTGMIKDISLTGMFIETEDSFKVGQLIIVNIPDTGAAGYVRVAAEIIRIQPDGIGVRFMSKGLST